MVERIECKKPRSLQLHGKENVRGSKSRGYRLSFIVLNSVDPRLRGDDKT